MSRCLTFRLRSWTLMGWISCGLLAASGCATGKDGWTSGLAKWWPSRASAPPAAVAATPQSAPTPKQQRATQFAVAHSLEQAGELPQAVEGYERVLKADPKHADAHRRLAIVSLQLGNTDTAEKHFQKALALEPKNADLLCDVAYYHYLQGQWRQSEDMLRRSLAIEPDSRRSHNILGMVQARAGRRDEALASFQRAGCSPAEADANLAFALMLDSRFDEAGKHLERSLAQSPNSSVLQKRAREVSVANKQVSRAAGTGETSLASAVSPERLPVVSTAGLPSPVLK